MKRLFAWFPILLALFPSSAFAFLDWQSSGADKSIEFLGILFGNVGTVLIPPEGGSLIMGSLFSVFNVVLLSMGSIVMAYTIWMSAIETAHEGQVLGRKWSAAWIPLRAMLGVGLLLPTSSGYSFSQIIMMWVVMHGVHAANAIWSIVLQNFELGAVYTYDSEDTEVKGASEAAQAMFESLICMEMIKQKYPDAIEGLGGELELYNYRDAIVIGVPGDEHHAQVCGGLQPSKAPSDYDTTVWRNQQLAAAENVAGALSVYAQEAVEGGLVSGSDVIMSARRIISGMVAGTPKGGEDPPTLDSVKQEAAENGWLYAGSYYHKFASWMTEFSPNNLTAPQAIRPDYSELPQLSKSEVEAMYNAYLEESDLLNEDEGTRPELDLSASEGMSDELAQFWDDAGITDFFVGMATDLIDALYADESDPIIGMQKLGADMMVAVEGSFFAILIAAFLIALIGCTLQGFLPVCWMLSAAFSILMPLLTILLMLMWSAGVALGLYVPLIPLLVFTFTAFTWFILVIEAMVAAPVAALGMTNPSAQNFGNIQPTMTLTLNLFLRPSLMVIGFIAAERILKAIMSMINFGYAATMEASLTGIGFFGAVVIVVLYAGIAIIAVQECFSLVHLLPDKVIRWIGGQIEKSNVESNVQSAKGSLDKGAQVGQQIMQGGIAAAGQMVGSSSEGSSDNSDSNSDDTGGGDEVAGDGSTGTTTSGGDPVSGETGASGASGTGAAAGGEVGASAAGGTAAAGGGAAAGGAGGEAALALLV